MKILTEYSAEEFLERKGFSVVDRKVFGDVSEAFKYAESLGFPVVLKVVSDKLLHKSEVGAVRLNVYKDGFFKVFNELKNLRLEKEGILVQKFVNGKYVLIGLKKDKTFGHVIVVGLGGIFAEVVKDVSFRVVPITKKDAVEMLKELKGYEVLTGYRGERVNINLVVDNLLKVSKLAEKNKNISELDINPLIVNSHSARIVDARIVFEG